MELRLFVKKTLKDILDGIHDAQHELEYGQIVPQLNEQGWKGLETGLTSYQAIDFEVAVNAVDQKGSEAKLNVVAAIIGGNVKGDSSSVAGHTAKLSFKIPVRLPIDSGKQNS
jgi:hypothetical protein